MKLPLTYHVIFRYKGEQETHQFTANRVLTRQMIEHNIEGHVYKKHGRDADITKLYVRTYRYEEND